MKKKIKKITTKKIQPIIKLSEMQFTNYFKYNFFNYKKNLKIFSITSNCVFNLYLLKHTEIVWRWWSQTIGAKNQINEKSPLKKKDWGGCVETVTILTKVMELNFQHFWFQSILLERIFNVNKFWKENLWDKCFLVFIFHVSLFGKFMK